MIIIIWIIINNNNNDIYEDIQEDMNYNNLAANNSKNSIKKDSVDSEKIN